MQEQLIRQQHEAAPYLLMANRINRDRETRLRSYRSTPSLNSMEQTQVQIPADVIIEPLEAQRRRTMSLGHRKPSPLLIIITYLTDGSAPKTP